MPMQKPGGWKARLSGLALAALMAAAAQRGWAGAMRVQAAPPPAAPLILPYAAAAPLQAQSPSIAVPLFPALSPVVGLSLGSRGSARIALPLGVLPVAGADRPESPVSGPAPRLLELWRPARGDSELRDPSPEELSRVLGERFDGSSRRSTSRASPPGPVRLPEGVGRALLALEARDPASLDSLNGELRRVLPWNWKTSLSLLRTLEPDSVRRLAPIGREFLRARALSSPAAELRAAELLAESLPRLPPAWRYDYAQLMLRLASRSHGAREALRRAILSRLPGTDAGTPILDVARRLHRFHGEGRLYAMELIALGMQDPAARGPLWEELKAAASRRRPALRERRGARRIDRAAALATRLPALWRLLKDPAETARFLDSLSALRQAVPYYLANRSPLPPMAFADREQMWFEYGELRIAPVSESFRRMIVTDRTGSYAVELKMPGQDRSRDMIAPHNYRIARELHKALPGSVARPLAYFQYAGSLTLYGARRRFDRQNPLGLLVLEYTDAKRLSNAEAMLAETARASGAGKEPAARRAKAAMAVAAAWLHGQGWAGNHPTRGHDMHGENIAVTPEGKARLVADFGAFERRPLAADQRREETLGLLRPYLRDRDPLHPDLGGGALRDAEAVAILIEAERIARSFPMALGEALVHELQLDILGIDRRGAAPLDGP